MMCIVNIIDLSLFCRRIGFDPENSLFISSRIVFRKHYVNNRLIVLKPMYAATRLTLENEIYI